MLDFYIIFILCYIILKYLFLGKHFDIILITQEIAFNRSFP